jgi:hypothetical protein
VGRARREIPAEWLSNCEFVCAEAVEWTRNTTLKNIKVLYLDNFDWDWSTNRQSEMIEQQREWYSSQGITMSNLNSQTSHITQMVNLLPHMSTQCVVCVDDTYEYNGVFIGKGGAVVPYLLGKGFALYQASDYGVILGRGQQNYIV